MWPIILLYWEILVPPLYLSALASALLTIILFWTSLTPFINKYFFFSHFTQDYLLTVTSCLGEVSFLICYELRNQVSQNYIYWILRKRLRDSPKNKTHGFQWVSESFCFGFSSSFRLPDKRFPDKWDATVYFLPLFKNW